MATVEEIGLFLIEKAEMEQFIFYLDVCKHFKLSVDLFPWRLHPLCDLFGSLDEQDARAGRPFRTALVISREHKRPGPGFYAALSKLTGRATLKGKEDEVWSEEVRAVFSYYAS